MSRVSVRSLIEAAAVVFEIDADDITGKCKIAPFVRARQAVFLIAREEGFSFPHIGWRVGRRDHTTVLSGCRTAEAYIARDWEYEEQVEDTRRLARRNALMTRFRVERAVEALAA